jgi:hypothetical protein
VLRNVHDRLASGAALLAQIDCRRRETRSRHLGSNIERMVIERELRELEEDLPRADTDSRQNRLLEGRPPGTGPRGCGLG